jgi:hypothetical protein
LNNLCANSAKIKLFRKLVTMVEKELKNVFVGMRTDDDFWNLEIRSDCLKSQVLFVDFKR